VILFSPELTADWEFRLAQMEHGKLKREQFMREIIRMTKHIVAQAKNYESDTIPGDFATLSARCPKCGGRVFELPAAYVCERAVGPAKTCDFRSGRIILQRPIERVQMQKLLASGKTDLLAFVSARTRRPFAAYLVRQPDGKIGFEFEAKAGAKGRGAMAARGATALRVLGPHPKDKQPVELHAGRYGPYVKHGGINATLPDKDRVDAVTLGEAVALLAAKSGKTRSARPAKGGKQGAKPAHRKRAA